LSDSALDVAIKEAFERFDLDKSGLIDRQEFEKAMYTLGLRLTADQYSELFEKCDDDKSGEVDIDAFTHMIKTQLLYRMCSLTIECVLLLRSVLSYYRWT